MIIREERYTNIPVESLIKYERIAVIATKRCLVDLGTKLKIMGDSSGFGKNKIKQKTLFELSLFLKSNFEIIVFFLFFVFCFFFTVHSLYTPEQVRKWL